MTGYRKDLPDAAVNDPVKFEIGDLIRIAGFGVALFIAGFFFGMAFVNIIRPV